MNYVLVFRPEVQEELSDAHSWYENQKPGLDDEFLECVDVDIAPHQLSKHKIKA